MLTSNAGAFVPLLAAILFLSCNKGPTDPTAQPITLGEMHVGIVASRAGTTDFSFRGRVTGFNTRDTLYSVQGLGSFKQFVALRDTLTNDTLRVYYTLPLNATFRVDTVLRAVVVYKQIESRFALIIKTKNDSLVCMVNSLLPGELDTIQTKSGDQRFRVSVGANLYAARNTACGREGDFDMVFSSADGRVLVAPAHFDQLISAEKIYTIFNVKNTQRIKDLNNCGPAGTSFVYMIIKQ